MKIADEHIQKLRAHGLFVSKPMPSRGVYPDGVLVGKPTTIVGNNIADYSTSYADLVKDSEVKFDAPPVWLYKHTDTWVVEILSYIPGRPGDFVDGWATPEEAIADIMDFFLGDPKRMEVKAADEALSRKRLQAKKQK
jgi:hypothetical protein